MSFFKAIAKYLKAISPQHTAEPAFTTIIGGNAVAVGTDTLTEGSVSLVTKSMGKVAIAKGSATFLAAAEISPDGAALASTVTYGGATGADIVITKSTASGWSGSDTIQSTSQLKLFALDISGFTPKNGPIVINISSKKPVATQVETLDGNIAIVSATATVSGGATHAGVETSATAIDGQLSMVTASALTLVA